MLDINLIRKNYEMVRANLEKRGWGLDLLEEVRKKDEEWRDLVKRVDAMRHERNVAARRVAEIKKSGGDASSEIQKMREFDKNLEALEKKRRQLEEEIRHLLLRIPNIMHESVPVGRDDTENVEIKRWGELRRFGFEPKSHVDLLELLDVADIPRAAKVAGARFFYLKRDLVWLDWAIMQYAMKKLEEKGFIPVIPPYMIRRRAIEGATSLDDFEDVIYKIEGEDLYLIPTAEHPLGAMFMDEIFEADELPLFLAGWSPCFRKEAGAHGKDTKGIFRTHQFHKVEQFVFCKPEESWEIHEQLLRNTEEMWQELGIPYRVVNICTGDLGIVAAKKYDVEAWMPAQGTYREVASCSNCTDYQARRWNIRFRRKPGAKPEFVHTLNNTALATGRTMVAILENYQQEDGSVVIPEVLRPFMGGRDRIVPVNK